ncbi:MAG: transposase [Acidobacteriota bacterium]|nr:transposase [Acidobacteriota bacterium]
MPAKKTYKFRLYPSKSQKKKLEEWLKLSCELYNAALQERRDAWSLNRISISYSDQNKQLTEIKGIRPELKDVNSHVLQDALRRLDKSFKAFFRRVKSGKTPGFPRFKSERRFHSFSVPKRRYKIADGRLDLSRFGKIKLRQDCEIIGEMTNLTVSREIGHWFACITVEFEPEKLPKSGEKIGIDLSYRYFAVLSDGTFVENPRHYARMQKKLRTAARRVARRKKGSHRRQKAVVLLAKVHQKIRRRRNDFQHKLSYRLVNRYGFLAVEDLAIKDMTKTDDAKYRNKSLYDAAWGEFLYKLEYKAANAGRELVKENPYFTSQSCVCGARLVTKPRQTNVICVSCGQTGNRGIISSKVILQSAERRSVQALT